MRKGMQMRVIYTKKKGGSGPLEADEAVPNSDKDAASNERENEVVSSHR